MLETVIDQFPESLDMNGMIDQVASYLPTDIDFVSTAKFLVLFFVGSLVFGALGRTILGKRSDLNHATSSAMGILFLYALTMIIYTFQPWELIRLLSPLPYITFADTFIVISPVLGTSLSLFCSQTLSLIILAFLVNLLDTFLPKGHSVFSWYGLRLLTVILSMAAHVLVKWACNTYLPRVLVLYAPVILLGILLCMLLLGVINVILGIVLTVIDPLFGGIYTFFFSNIIGKQLSKAVLSSAIICTLLILLDHFGYTVISITSSALLSYIPFGIILLVLWYLIGHLF